jgi:hypothetical protein
MSRPKHYSPEIKRFIVSALYHEAKARGVPMTVLTNELLTAGLQHTDGWQKAREAMLLKDSSPPYQVTQPGHKLVGLFYLSVKPQIKTRKEKHDRHRSKLQ